MRRAIPILLFWVAALLPAAAQAEVRGLWVDAFHPGIKSKEQVAELVAFARARSYNTLFVQVRRRGDVYYQSQLESRARDIPRNFDPLAEVLAAAHRTNDGPRVEVHAWLAVYPVWDKQLTPPPPDHLMARHPNWITQNATGSQWDGESFSMDPGHPEVQEHCFEMVMELLGKYPVDGIHLDRVRYAGPQWGYNEVSLRRFQLLNERTDRPSPEDAEWAAFRRDQVTALIRRVYISAAESRPDVAISAATITWAPAPKSQKDWELTAPYSRVLQDWKGWLEEGILNLAVPMTYFREPSNSADFQGWVDFFGGLKRRETIVVGLGGYLNPPSTTKAQAQKVTAAVEASNLLGWALYSYAQPDIHSAGQSPQTPGILPASSPLVTPHPSLDGHLKGLLRVRNGIEAPLEATVVVEGEATRTALTDATGFYGLAHLAPGQYRVWPLVPRYRGVTNVVQVSAGRVTTLDFDLRQLK